MPTSPPGATPLTRGCPAAAHAFCRLAGRGRARQARFPACVQARVGPTPDRRATQPAPFPERPILRGILGHDPPRPTDCANGEHAALPSGSEADDAAGRPSQLWVCSAVWAMTAPRPLRPSSGARSDARS
jgi:hypothetical protein